MIRNSIQPILLQKLFELIVAEKFTCTGIHCRDPQTSEERHQVLLLKKQIVDAILQKAQIDGNREIHIKFRSDLTIRTD